MMSNSITSSSITQYGVQTPTSSTILIVTTGRAEAEHALNWITDGRVVHRTIPYRGWQSGDGDLALAG
ncbi:MAG: hypothetical protein NVSMB60_07760 [Mycobacterium sp.]